MVAIIVEEAGNVAGNGTACGAEFAAEFAAAVTTGVAGDAGDALSPTALEAALETGAGSGTAVTAAMLDTTGTALGGSGVGVYGAADVVVANKPFTGGTDPGGSKTPIR
jgi:hypothetical protein